MSRLVSRLFGAVALVAALSSVGVAHAEAPHARNPTGAPHAATDGTGGASSSRKGALTGVVNLNQGDEAALELLPGVGPTRAQLILEWRKAHPFKKVEDLTRIHGIGRKTFARLKPFVTVTGTTTLSDGKAARKTPGGEDGMAEEAHP